MASAYKCKEVDLRGQVIENIYRGDTQEEIIQMIRGKGHKPIQIELEETKGQELNQLSILQPHVKTKDLAIFCKQLHTMLTAGMPLITALDVLAAQSENRTLSAATRDVGVFVQKGEILSSALKKFPKIFPKLLVNMVESGELTGNLDQVLLRMSEHYTKENKINSKIKSAMIYPIILSCLAVGVVVFLLVFIMPTFLSMFESSGVALPGPTRVMLSLSKALKGYWYLFIAGILALILLFKFIASQITGRRVLHRIKLKLPVIGKTSARIATSRFTRTLSTLLASGIPIMQALEAAGNVTDNQIVMDGIERLIEDIKKGSALSILLRRIGIFPPMMISMVGIGEESGALEEMLEKTADYYDEELETAIQKMISILEPMMILLMAVVIGFIVISMMLPMFDMLKTVK